MKTCVDLETLDKLLKRDGEHLDEELAASELVLAASAELELAAPHLAASAGKELVASEPLQELEHERKHQARALKEKKKDFHQVLLAVGGHHHQGSSEEQSKHSAAPWQDV